jgi:Tol biopolymer transport system component
MAEVFIADLPDDLTVSGDGPLQGTSSTRPRPPAGTTQRRLTFTFERKYPGVWYPRHWLRSSPDGSRIAFLQRDDEGIVQIWTVSPNGGPPLQVTRNSFNISSAFTWSPDGRRIAHVAGNRVCVTDADTGRTTRLTLALPPEDFLRPEACVFSPDGNRIAYARPVPTGATLYNQVFVCDVQC